MMRPLAARRALISGALLIALSMGQALAATPRLEVAGAKALGISRLDQAATQLDQAFEAPFEVNTREGGATAVQPATVQSAANCRALLQLTDRIQGTPSAVDWPVLLSQLAVCQSLQALAHVQPAQRSALPTRWTSLSATRDWPASIWPNIDADSSRAADRPGQTLARWLKQTHWRLRGNAKDHGITALLENDSVALALQPLARGDFDADGLEDWLVLWQAHAKGGSWAATRALLVSRQPGQRALRLTWLPEPPH